MLSKVKMIALISNATLVVSIMVTAVSCVIIAYETREIMRCQRTIRELHEKQASQTMVSNARTREPSQAHS
jgi:cell division protein FtsL